MVARIGGGGFTRFPRRCLDASCALHDHSGVEVALQVQPVNRRIEVALIMALIVLITLIAGTAR